jgi:hypothetical protein
MTNAIAIITAIHLAALSQMESGDRDAAVGSSGEITRYQIMPREARREICAQGLTEVLPADWSLNPDMSARIARGLWLKRVETFQYAHRRNPTTQELYLLWHRPGRVLNPHPRELERAQRFENLVQEAMKTNQSENLCPKHP